MTRPRRPRARRADLPEVIQRRIDRLPIENTRENRVILTEAKWFHKYDDVLTEEDIKYAHDVTFMFHYGNR